MQRLDGSPPPLVDYSLLNGDSASWIQAAGQRAFALPQICWALLYLEQHQETTEKGFYVAREHILHILGYRKRSFEHFTKLGRNQEFMLYQKGLAKGLRTRIFAARSLQDLRSAALELHQYCKSRASS